MTAAFYNEDLRTPSSRVTDVVDNQVADPHIPINRYDIIGMFRQHLTDNLVAYGDGMTVSDSLFLREMNVVDAVAHDWYRHHVPQQLA